MGFESRAISARQTVNILVKHVIIVFSFTSADKVPCDSRKTAPNTSSIVEIMFGQII